MLMSKLKKKFQQKNQTMHQKKLKDDKYYINLISKIYEIEN